MCFNLLAALKTYEIVIIVVVAAVFACVIAAALIFVRRRRKNDCEPVLASRDVLGENLRAVQELEKLAPDNQIQSALGQLHRALLKIQPSAEEEAAVLDGKIRDGLYALKRELLEGSGSAALPLMEEINSLVSKRAQFTED